MKHYITRIQEGHNLTETEIKVVMGEIMSGDALEADIENLLSALNEKGPTVDEIVGAAKIMRQQVVPVETKHVRILDTCGTGGDGKDTFNISTLAAFVVAGCGVAVAKHGNRKVSSTCGSACVLEALGVNLEVEQNNLSKCLDEVGVAFLFAQKLHPAMKYVAHARKTLAVKTIFNILGPLTNPARATHQVMGVYSRDLVEPMARVFQKLGLKRALVVHGNDGLDEITTTDVTFVAEFNGKGIVTYEVDPEEFGIKRAVQEDLQVSSIEQSAAIALEVLKGRTGPHRDIVAVNAAYALYTAGAVDNLSDALRQAKDSIDSGRALQKLEQLKEFTHRV